MVESWPDAEWDDEQLELIAAEQIIRVNTGPNGEWMPDATNPDVGDPMKYSGVRFLPDGPHVNWAEKERLDAIAAHRKSLGEDANMNGVFFTVKRVEYEKPSEVV